MNDKIKKEMSYDEYTLEMHLTRSRGWVDGTASYNDETVSRPFDAVETWLKTVEQSSGFVPADTQWELIWKSDAISGEELAALHAKFPHPRIALSEAAARHRKLNSDLRNWKTRRK